MNTTVSRRLLGRVAVLVVAALVLTAPVTAKSATVSTSGPNTVAPGETVTVTLTVTNTGDSPSAFINDVTLPNGWTVASHSDGSGTWKSSESKWLWQTVQPGETVETSVTLQVPANATREYSVDSIVKSSEGVEATANHTITVETANQAPNADAGSAQTIQAGSSVSLDASASIDPDGDIQTYEWDVDGDGATETTGKQTVHTYNDPGTYEVTLAVVDATGNTDTETIVVTVQPEEETVTTTVQERPSTTREPTTVTQTPSPDSTQKPVANSTSDEERTDSSRPGETDDKVVVSISTDDPIFWAGVVAIILVAILVLRGHTKIVVGLAGLASIILGSYALIPRFWPQLLETRTIPAPFASIWLIDAPSGNGVLIVLGLLLILVALK